MLNPISSQEPTAKKKNHTQKGYSTIACIPFLLNITMRWTFPTGLHTVYKTS